MPPKKKEEEKKIKVYRGKLSDLKPNPRNENKGTERGNYMLNKSVEMTGAGRGVVADANKVLIGGHHIADALAENDLDDVIFVETDGKTLVVTVREDLDVIEDEDLRATLLARFDNRSQEVNYRPDAAVLVEDIERGLDLTIMYAGDEIDELRFEAELEGALAGQLDSRVDVGGGSSGKNIGRGKTVKMVVHMPDVSLLEKAIAQTGLQNRAAAIVAICEAYVSGEGGLVGG